jgi:hypothetical protein
MPRAGLIVINASKESEVSVQANPRAQENPMRIFGISLFAAILFALCAAVILNTVWQQRADEAFAVATSVRGPSHGSTHNLVGKDWLSAKDH